MPTGLWAWTTAPALVAPVGAEVQPELRGRRRGAVGRCLPSRSTIDDLGRPRARPGPRRSGVTATSSPARADTLPAVPSTSPSAARRRAAAATASRAASSICSRHRTHANMKLYSLSTFMADPNSTPACATCPPRPAAASGCAGCWTPLTRSWPATAPTRSPLPGSPVSPACPWGRCTATSLTRRRSSRRWPPGTGATSPTWSPQRPSSTSAPACPTPPAACSRRWRRPSAGGPGFLALWYGGLRTERIRDATRPTREAIAVSVERILAVHWPRAMRPAIVPRPPAWWWWPATGCCARRSGPRCRGDEQLLAESRLMLGAYVRARLGDEQA